MENQPKWAFVANLGDAEIVTGRVEMRRRYPAAFHRRRRSKSSKV